MAVGVTVDVPLRLELVVVGKAVAPILNPEDVVVKVVVVVDVAVVVVVEEAVVVLARPKLKPPVGAGAPALVEGAPNLKPPVGAAAPALAAGPPNMKPEDVALVAEEDKPKPPADGVLAEPNLKPVPAEKMFQ